ncbi:MAG: ADP-ribosylglycohydrolase family protein [Pseudomonadota bacterium]
MHAAVHPRFETDRAAAVLYGLALGDALGMPSQTLSREEIRQHYGAIDDFVAPYPGHPVSSGLRAAQVTDDTEQSLLLARRLIRDPLTFDAQHWARDLLDWETSVRRRGLLDLLGPSSKAALEAIRRGVDPAEAAKAGTTNGAAMRIAPVGIAVPTRPLTALVDAVERTCRATHNTGEAIAAAAAVAGFISGRIDGAALEFAVARALEAAKLGQKRGHPAGVSDMAERITQAVEMARAGIGIEAFADHVGTSVASHEAVPAAFGILVMASGDVWRAGLLAANVGDDTDTIGAMACAMCGAGTGMRGIPADKLKTLKSANDLAIDTLSNQLVALRNRAAKPTGMVAS